jgi:hypothetical protein
MDDIQRTLKFITHEHIEYRKEILIYLKASREDIQDEHTYLHIYLNIVIYHLKL